MNELDRFSERLRQALGSSLIRPEVSASWSIYYKIFVFVVSPTFEGMDEGERQEIAWGAALDTFTEDEQRRIEFIYTDAPSEVDPAEPSVALPTT